jgi:Tfp pilus assembly protein PilV
LHRSAGGSGGTGLDIRSAMTKERGFTYIEILVACFVFFGALFFIGSSNMSSLRLMSKSKIQQKATLLLMNKVEELRAEPIETIVEGTIQEQHGVFRLECTVQDHTPFFGTKQIRCRVFHQMQTIVETLFYRSE